MKTAPFAIAFPGSLQTANGKRNYWTTSRVEMWWLKFYRGYRIVCAQHVPKRAVFGHIQYESVWCLQPGLSRAN